jgi:hypothetical protein
VKILLIRGLPWLFVFCGIMQENRRIATISAAIWGCFATIPEVQDGFSKIFLKSFVSLQCLGGKDAFCDECFGNARCAPHCCHDSGAICVQAGRKRRGTEAVIDQSQKAKPRAKPCKTWRLT